MQTLRVVNETLKNCIISWPIIDMADEYIIEGMTNVFYYEPIDVVNENFYTIDKIEYANKYISYRVRYVKQNIDCIASIDVTNDIKVNSNLDIIELNAIESFNGGSISFMSEKHYDKYTLYCNELKMHIETEDCIITGDFIRESYTYQVNGYICNEDGLYTLAAASNEWVCTFSGQIGDIHPIISVIIPVYNCYDFLPRTIDSVLLSTFKNIELLLIDDGSKDGSFDICEWYERKYDCVKSFYKNNGGVCTARNYGMDKSIGEFIAFVDNDDIVHPYMYEKLYNTAIIESTDIAIAQTIIRDDFNSNRIVLGSKSLSDNIVMNSFVEVMKAKGSYQNIYFVAVWNKIIRRDVAMKVRFVDELPYYEDTAYTAPVYSYIDKFVLVNGAYYIWDKRKQKTVGTASTLHYHRPNEVIWKYYILSYAAPLFYGNKDDDIVMNAYKFDVLHHLLDKYISKNYSNLIKNVFRGMLKYLVREYDLPVAQLLLTENDRKLYAAWTEIEQSDTIEYDGIGDIPEEYY